MNDNQLITCSISEEQVFEKPIKGSPTFGKIVNKFKTRTLPLNEIIDLALSGYPTSPYQWLNSYPSVSGFISNQMHFVDIDNASKINGVKVRIDNPWSPQMIIDMLDEYGLKCNYLLKSLSYTEDWERYRVIFVRSEPVINARQAKLYDEGFYAIFRGAADRDSMGLHRWYLPHTGVLYANPNYRLDSQSGSLERLHVAIDTYTTKVYDKNVSPGIILDAWDIENLQSYNISTAQKTQRKRITKEIKLDDKTINLLYKNINIFKRFSDLEKINHFDVFGLATNLYPFIGGFKIITDTFEKYNKKNSGKEYDDEDFKILASVKKNQYPSANLIKFFGENSKSMIGFIKQRFIPNQEKFITLAESEQLLAEAVQKFQSDGKGVIRIIKSETGTGKTEHLLKMQNTLMAFPTHNLVLEVSERLNSLNISHLKTTGLPLSLLTKADKDFINQHYAIGDFQTPNKYLNELALISDDEKCREQLNDYLYRNKEALSTEGICLTTHEKALFSSSTHKAIVFDEDIATKLFKLDSVLRSDLTTLVQLLHDDPLFGPENDDFKAVQTWTNSLDTRVDKMTKNDLLLSDSEEVEKIILSKYYKFKSPIIKFIQCKYYTVKGPDEVAFINTNFECFSTKKKYLILSATVNRFFYDQFKNLGFTVEYDEIPRIKHSSKIYQDRKFSFSKWRFTKFLTSVEREKETKKPNKLSSYYTDLKAKIDGTGLPVITHLTHKNEFENGDPHCHFFNCSGYNHLEGRDLIVVGAPNMDPSNIALYAACLGKEFGDEKIPICQNVTVRNKAGEFNYYTFEDELLRRIHLAFHEEGIIQAVGRCRHIRNSVNILIFNKYRLFSEAIDIDITTIDNLSTSLNLMSPNDLKNLNEKVGSKHVSFTKPTVEGLPQVLVSPDPDLEKIIALL